MRMPERQSPALASQRGGWPPPPPVYLCLHKSLNPMLPPVDGAGAAELVARLVLRGEGASPCEPPEAVVAPTDLELGGSKVSCANLIAEVGGGGGCCWHSTRQMTQPS